jgi:hypothetical protein
MPPAKASDESSHGECRSEILLYSRICWFCVATLRLTLYFQLGEPCTLLSVLAWIPMKDEEPNRFRVQHG